MMDVMASGLKSLDLPEGSHLYYRERKAFVRAYQIAEKVISLYNENLSTEFDIKAKTYRDPYQLQTIT